LAVIGAAHAFFMSQIISQGSARREKRKKNNMAPGYPIKNTLAHKARELK
jgi:hypothetical protein